MDIRDVSKFEASWRCVSEIGLRDYGECDVTRVVVVVVGYYYDKSCKAWN